MTDTIVAGYARTPFAKYLGALAATPSTTLGGHAGAAALAAAGLTGESVEAVVVGQVLAGAVGQNPPRQAAVAAGVPMTVPAIGISAVCLSGTEAIVAGHRMIQLGEAEVVLAIGQESMSLAPHAAPMRTGARFGGLELVDTMEVDGLTDAFERRSMGASTEARNAEHGLTREEQDAFAAESHRRLADAQAAGALDDEIAPIEVRRGRETVVVAVDDGVRPETTVESLARLRPAFDREHGTITAGNASQITDGAAAVVLVSSAAAARLGVRGIARVRATGLVAGPDVSLHAQPSNAIEQALGRMGARATDLAAVEINEAFAAVGIVSTRALGVDPAIVNAEGGAIALGHPIGASGARIVGHLAHRLRAAGAGSLGAVGICGGGGQGSAVVLEAL